MGAAGLGGAGVELRWVPGVLALLGGASREGPAWTWEGCASREPLGVRAGICPSCSWYRYYCYYYLIIIIAIKVGFLSKGR